MSVVFAFASCSKSDSEEEEIDDVWEERVDCGFSLNWNRGDSDHAKVLKTTCTYAWGSEEGEVLDLDDENRGTIEETNEKIPNTLTITITEELRPEVDLTADVSYKLSFGFYLKVAAYMENSVTGERLEGPAEVKSVGTSVTVPAKNLSKMYPKETTLKYTIDEEGTVSLVE